MPFRVLFLIAASLLGFTPPVFAYYGALFEPPDGTILHGVGWNYRDSQNIYSAMFPADKKPLILQVNTSIPGMRGTTVERIVQALTQPIVHADSQYIEYSMHFQGNDALMMLDSIYVYTDQWDQYVDMLESAFRQVNLPFFFRIGFEFNGSWNPYHPYIYPLAFRQLVIDLNSRGIDNFATVWCYEPDAAADFADSTEQGWKWYPGDDVVDWFGLDLFTVEHFHPDLPDSAQGRTGWDITRKGRSEAFLRFAEVRGKPVYLNELSSIHTVSTPDSLDPEGIDGQADWDAWFEPFFRFIQAHPNIKGWNYIDVDWSSINSYQQQGWRDARLEINSILRRRWVHQMSSGNVIHAGCRLDSMTEAPALPPLVPTKLSLTTYPNPFNSLLTIRITPVRSAATAAAVFTLDGRRLWEQTFPPSAGSEFAVIWDGSKAAAGLYLIRVASGNSMTLRKALLLR